MIFSKTLEIFIITYNRAEILRSSLVKICKEAPNNIRVTVLDNHSTDNTEAIVANLKLQHNNLFQIRNVLNIGANANILRVFEYATADYVWILGDDDDYNLKGLEDLVIKLGQSDFNLVHVGAHGDNWLYGGKEYSPKQLMDLKYPYFMYSSFIGCNIFRREKFIQEYLIKGYDNIVNAYPHMPFVQDIYLNNENIYLSERKYVRAVEGNQSYSNELWFNWWLGNALRLEKIDDIRMVFFNHFNDVFSDSLIRVMEKASRSDEKARINVEIFVHKYLTYNEKLLFRTFGLRKSNPLKFFKRIKRKILSIFEKVSTIRRIK